jgi:hypothetical protein
LYRRCKLCHPKQSGRAIHGLFHRERNMRRLPQAVSGGLRIAREAVGETHLQRRLQPAQALAEMRRVLRPGGALLFVEHGRAPEPAVARWQDRLDPPWSRLAGGCNLNRKRDDLIGAGGFRIEALENARIPGPRTHTYLYQGCALPA